MKKILSVLLVVVTLFAFAPCFAGAHSPGASVAIATQAKAKVGMNISSKTLYRGQFVQLKVNGTKQKVTWASSNTKIALVSKNGKVKGVSGGNALITAKVGGKKYYCKIKVLNAFFTQNIAASYYNLGTGKGIVGILKNYNKTAVKITMKVLYYCYGSLVGQNSTTNYCLEKGKRCALNVSAPYDSNYDDVYYTKYKVFLKVEKCPSEMIPLTSKVRVAHVDTGYNVVVGVKNAGKIKIGSLQLAIVYFNEYGKCIGYDYHYAECERPGSVDYITFDYPYDSNYDTLYPTSYKLYFVSGYSYNWEL